MYNPKLASNSSLTGQARVESLNVIYNRVALLKSKNVNRKLLAKDNSQIINLDPNEDRNDNNFAKIRGLDESKMSNNSILNKYKFMDDKETDDLQTNFWPSQGGVRQNNSRVQTASREIPQKVINNQINHRRKFLSTKQPIHNISKTLTTQPRFRSNRNFLMSDFNKNYITNQPSQQVSNKNLIVSKIKDKDLPKKRPMTSSINRQRMSFRINDLSRAKQQLHRNQSTQQKPIINQPYLAQTKLQQKGSKKSLTGSRVSLIKGQTRLNTYKKQLQNFESLYQCLSLVLASIKQGLHEVDKAVTRYSNFIQAKRISFIDDFMQGRQPKLQKVIRTTRLHETLSICYLFLQIAQQTMQDNESYLVNFIGHSLSNLLLVVRVYILKEGKAEFQKGQFQLALEQMQIGSYGQQLTSINDVMLRIQHNNQIITMIHKRLGRNHEKFESCIVNFLKNAQRQKRSCSLCAHYIFEFLAMHIHELQMVGISPSLQLAPQPYTPPAQKQYTLVIEPLGILQRNGKYRPYVNQFMKWASKNFDVVLWTWELPYAVEQIFETLSPYIVSRLYRHHCTVQNDIFVKDLSRLGRNLDKTIIIDFDKRIFGHHPNNGIQCRWKGGIGDKNLLVLSQIFEEMISSATTIQDTLTFYAEEILSIRGY